MNHQEMMKTKALFDKCLDECTFVSAGRRAAQMRLVLEMLIEYCDTSNLKEVRVDYLGNLAREVLRG